MYQSIILSIKRPVATIVMNRPEARNAFNPQMITEISDALCEIKNNPGVRLVIFRGSNQQFCSGADIHWMKESGSQPESVNKAESQKIADLLQAIDQIAVPTLAVAEGGIFGGALGILAACDWVYAHPDSTFGFPEVHLGIIPAVIWPFILLKCHPQIALQKALTGKPFKQEEALRMNLVDPLPAEDLEASISLLIKQLTEGPSPAAQIQIKALTKKLQQKPPESVIKETIEILTTLKQSPDGQEGLLAFIQKRKPEWK